MRRVELVAAREASVVLDLGRVPVGRCRRCGGFPRVLTRNGLCRPCRAVLPQPGGQASDRAGRTGQIGTLNTDKSRTRPRTRRAALGVGCVIALFLMSLGAVSFAQAIGPATVYFIRGQSNLLYGIAALLIALGVTLYAGWGFWTAAAYTLRSGREVE